MSAVENFKAKAPGIMAQLIRDFPELTPLDAAAIVGNLGHESGGLATLQEIKPIVPGSAGGYGWAQWTGPRRRAYEAYCKRNGLKPASDKANYAWLFLELKGIEGTEGKAIAKTIGAGPNLEAKVKAFELAFLRAHKNYKHYPSRLQWAERALEAWRSHKSTGIPIPNPTPAPAPNPADPVAHANAKGATAGIITSVLIAIGVVVWFVFFKR